MKKRSIVFLILSAFLLSSCMKKRPPVMKEVPSGDVWKIYNQAYKLYFSSSSSSSTTLGNTTTTTTTTTTGSDNKVYNGSPDRSSERPQLQGKTSVKDHDFTKKKKKSEEK